MKTKKTSNVNLLFGSSSSIGLNFLNLFKNKNFIFYSRSKIAQKNVYWKYLNLDEDIKVVPNKVNKVFFLASPYYLKKNLKKNIYSKEKKWLKKICSKVKSNVFIYISSSSVYQKNHVIGLEKMKCENFLKKNSNSKCLQIWRPFNILSNHYSKNLSDHFHNILIKKFIIQKKNYHNFKGSEKDTRGYSSAKKFCRLIYKKSSLKKNFVCDYGNSNSLTVKKIIDIFKKSINREITYNFSSFKKDINIVSNNKKVNFINTKENTSKLLKNYFDNFINLNEN